MKRWGQILTLVLLIFCEGCSANHSKKEIKNNSSARIVPDRTILFIIDGLAQGAPERMPLENFNSLKQSGCYYKSIYLPLPAHPAKSEDYPYTCSIPNLVMMTGTVFLKPDVAMLQDSFKGQKTAFVVNAPAYVSINNNYTIYEALETTPAFDDETVVNRAKEIIENQNPAFLRIHLQGSGIGGYQSTDKENSDKPYYQNIWYPESPYIKSCQKNDRLLGELVKFLQDTGKMGKTVILVMGDHGQAKIGGHPPYEQGGPVTPLLIFGCGITKGKTFDYAEMIDIAPSIAYLHNVPAPKDSIGRVLFESIEEQGKTTIPDHRYMERLDAALMEQHKFLNEKGEPLNPILELPQWHKQFTDMKSLVEYQEKAVLELKSKK